MGRTSSITMRSMVGILGRAPAVDEKVSCFFVCLFLSRFGMTKFVITETLWSSISFKRIMVSLHRGRFVVVHGVTDVQVFLLTPRIFPAEQIFTKNYHFWRLLEPYGHIFKATTVKFGTMVRSWGSLAQAKFCNNRLREYTPLGQMYTKKYHSLRFFGP